VVQGVSSLADLGIQRASSLLERGEISSRELVAATLERIEQTEAKLHAYAMRISEEAMACARRADSEPRRGPLHGIPFAVKDTLNTAGTPTVANSRLLASHVPTFDATVVRRLREAGAILIGKHATHEFALGADNPPTRNPWDLTRFAGGSSIGSGASVAVRSAMLSVGTDAGGSTRVPAALSGVVGLKPTYGRVSTFGTVPGAAVPGVEHIGLFTSSVGDAALTLASVSGPDPEDPRTMSFEPFAAGGEPDRLRARIGVLDSVHPGQYVEPAVAAAVRVALNVLHDLGAELIPVTLDLELAPAAHTILVATAAASTHLPDIRRRNDQFSDGVRNWLKAALLIPAQHLWAARAEQTRIRRRVKDLFQTQELDLLASPTAPCQAPLLSEFDARTDIGPMTAFTMPWNLTGQPALSVPCGFSNEGLPVGLQLVGRPLKEATVLSVASAYERAAGIAQLDIASLDVAAPRA
jgi:aspartyl-tRNA(Asn)/glutamyl-tRNA(Gln) amidotransferase subunit A